MVFKSKVDIWMALIFILLPILMIYGVITEPSAIFFLIATLIIVLLCILFFGTKYEIEEDELVIYGGLYKKRIQIGHIRTLRPSKNPLSAPAMSIDRIEITFDPHVQTILVSPKDKDLFVKMLLAVNPGITIHS